MQMTNVERFKAAMNFQKPDRLPVIEWAGWWDKTIERWRGEGLPQVHGELREYLGLDCYRQLWIGARRPGCPEPAFHGGPLMEPTMDGYNRLKQHLYPELDFRNSEIANWAERQKSGEMVVWISLDGFFWWPRVLLGIEPHLYAFYDQPELMHQINQDLLNFMFYAVDKFCEVCVPTFMTFGEDMSYNHGPMLSKALFDEFLAPYYREILPVLKDRGILAIVDSDGDVTNLIPWLEEVGVEGLLPFERQSGVDVAQIRANHPNFRMIGAYDKMVMNKGEEAIRAEFERLLPVMRTGGFIPSVDHQTPPGVSLEQYRCYVSLLHEYARKAAE